MAILYPLRFGAKDPTSPACTLFPMRFGEASSSFDGITGMIPIGDGRFRISWGVAGGTLTAFKIYVKSSASVFSGGTVVAMVDPNWTSFDIHLSDEDTPFCDGVIWYCGVRALSTSGVEDLNTAELYTSTYGASKAIRLNIGPAGGPFT